MNADDKKTASKLGNESLQGQTKNVVVETKRKRVVVPKPGTTPSRPAGISDAELERRMKALQAAKAREEEETQKRAEGSRRRPQKKKNQSDRTIREVPIYEGITVSELAVRMSERAADVAKALMQNGISASQQQALDTITAELIVEEFGHIAVQADNEAIQDSASEEEVYIAVAIASLQKETIALKDTASRLSSIARGVIDHV